MQFLIKTRSGTVELSFRKLRLFRRVAVLEAKEETTEHMVAALGRRVAELEKVAGACPYKHRAEEPVERPELTRDESGAEGEEYTASDLFTEWTEGEEVAIARRRERQQMSEDKAKRGGSGA